MKNIRPKFCYACGSPLRNKVMDENERLICERCQTITYINSKPCVEAVIVNKDKILLTRRKYEPFRGYWDIPGGFLEDGEHPKAGLRREIQEELGLDIEIEAFFGIFMDTYGDEGESTLCIAYTCTNLGTPQFVADDVAEYRWFPLDELPEELAFNHTKEALRQLEKRYI